MDDPEGALRQAYHDAEKQLQKSNIDCNLSGCTAVTALRHDGHIIVANAGDSRCVLGRAEPVAAGASSTAKGGVRSGVKDCLNLSGSVVSASTKAGRSSPTPMQTNARLRAIDLSSDHTPHRPDEAARIRYV